MIISKYSFLYILQGLTIKDCTISNCNAYVCPANDDCFIDCTGDSACADSTIYCPDNANCTIDLNTFESAEFMTLHAETSTKLTVNCPVERSCWRVDNDNLTKDGLNDNVKYDMDTENDMEVVEDNDATTKGEIDPNIDTKT